MESISSLKVEDNINKIHVVVSEEATKRYLDNYATVLQQTERLAGFRDGKAPLDVIHRQFRRKIREKAATFMMPKFTAEALENLGLIAGSRPTLAASSLATSVKTWLGEYGIDGKFSFDIDSPVVPTLDKVMLKDVVLEFDQNRIDDGIDEQISHLRHELVVKKPTNAPATKHDEITCSIGVFNADGTEIEQLRISSFPFSFDLSREQLLSQGLAEALLGSEEGQHIELTEGAFTFKVDVEKIRSKELPQITDEMLSSWGYESMEHMREQIREEWVAVNAPMIRREMHNVIRKELALQNDFDLPNVWKEEAIAILTSRLSQMGAALDQYREGLEAQADIIARSDFLLELIWETNSDKLALTEQDLLFYAREEVNTTGLPAEDYLSQLISLGQYFSWSIGHRKTKVLDFLTQQLKMNQSSSIEFNTSVANNSTKGI